MAAKASWKGAIKVGFVSFPVAAIATAESSERISFNQLHKGCNARIQQKKVCSACAAEVKNEDLLKGYEFSKGQYVTFSDEEIAKVKVASERTISLTAFPSGDAIDPLLIDRSLFLVPDGKVGLNTYHVVKKALESRNAIGIGRVCLNGSERQVSIEPRGRGLMMHVLHEAKEVRNIDKLDALELVPTVSPQEVQLASALMEQLDEPVDLSEFEDAYKAGVRKMIEAKVNGEEFVAATDSEPEAPAASSLADMLQSSLAAIQTLKKPKPAKAELKAATVPQPVATAAHKAPRKRKAS